MQIRFYRRELTLAAVSLIAEVTSNKRLDPLLLVHVKDEHCGAAHGGKADDYNVRQLKMLFPRVLTRVEKRGDLARFRINACEIGAFV